MKRTKIAAIAITLLLGITAWNVKLTRAATPPADPASTIPPTTRLIAIDATIAIVDDDIYKRLAPSLLNRTQSGHDFGILDSVQYESLKKTSNASRTTVSITPPRALIGNDQEGQILLTTPITCIAAYDPKDPAHPDAGYVPTKSKLDVGIAITLHPAIGDMKEYGQTVVQKIDLSITQLAAIDHIPAKIPSQPPLQIDVPHTSTDHWSILLSIPTSATAVLGGFEVHDEQLHLPTITPSPQKSARRLLVILKPQIVKN